MYFPFVITCYHLAICLQYSSLISTSLSISIGRLVDRSVGQSVSQSVAPQSVLSQNGWLDPDAIWDGEWGRSRDGCIRWGWLSSKGKGSSLVKFGASHCNQWGLCCIVVCEPIELLFGTVSGVTPGIHVLHGSPHASRGRSGFWGLFPIGQIVSMVYFVTEMYLTRAWKVDNISVRQYIVGIYV